MNIINSTLRLWVILVLSINYAFCQTSPQELLGKHKEVIIEGKLSNIKSEKVQITIKYSDLISGEPTTHIIQTNGGKFQFKFQKYNVQDATLAIGEISIPLLLVPGKDIQIQVDANNTPEPIKFTGSNSKFNTDFYNAYKALTAYNTTIDSAQRLVNSLNPDAYKSFVINNEKKLSVFLADYQQQYPIENEVLDWLKTYIQYKMANYLIYPYFVKSEKYHVESDYWDFFDTYPINNEHAVFCSEYLRYCAYYFGYLANIKGVFSESFKYYGNNWSQFYEITIDSLKKNLEGIASDILISGQLFKFMKDDLASFGESIDDLLVSIKNEDIRNILAERFFDLNHNMENINASQEITMYDYRKNTAASNILDTLLTKYKNKLIYIDNWASWCGPCIAEMPYSIELQKDFREKDVVFVYLCSPDNYMNDRAKIIIADKQIPGEHYLMSFPQQISIQDKFKNNMIPRYMIINKKGEIIDNDAPRPSSHKVREILNEQLKL